MCGSSTLTHGSARCPAGSGCRAHKTPGEPSIRCCRWQSITLHLVPAVAHPNRDEGDLRARVGLSAVLRVQAARLLLFAIEPPDDDTQLIVGIDKANAPPAHRQPSTGRCHAITRAAREVWAIEEITDAVRLTSGSGMRGTALIVITVGVIAGHWCLLLLITACSNAPTSSPSTRSPAQTKVPQTRRSTGG